MYAARIKDGMVITLYCEVISFWRIATNSKDSWLIYETSSISLHGMSQCVSNEGSAIVTYRIKQLPDSRLYGRKMFQLLRTKHPYKHAKKEEV